MLVRVMVLVPTAKSQLAAFEINLHQPCHLISKLGLGTIWSYCLRRESVIFYRERQRSIAAGRQDCSLQIAFAGTPMFPIEVYSYLFFRFFCHV